MFFFLTPKKTTSSLMQDGLETVKVEEDQRSCYFSYFFQQNFQKTSYNRSHIKLGHLVQQPYCNKTLCSFPPSVEFFASVMHANPQKPTLSIEQLM